IFQFPAVFFNQLQILAAPSKRPVYPLNFLAGPPPPQLAGRSRRLKDYRQQLQFFASLFGPLGKVLS
ncbi:hypothetical protein, partial [Burkholderia stagnalis]|uniref:hypothetical protein n=1 Tax=Burkholderia stagnalis TaxID=1503054 RepID=UPI001C892B68